jgi:predicted dehydrogenase
VIARTRSAIVGAGFIGGVHAAAVRAAGGVIVGVADSDVERARLLQARVWAERATASAGELISAEDVDVVHVCTPNAVHAPLVKEVLRAGKHVICEKPLATSAKEAAALEGLAARTGVVAAVPFVYRYYPMLRELRERVRGGEAGRLTMLHGSYLQDWLARETDSDWRVDQSQGGLSRAFGDIGVHWVDLIEFVSGQRITRASAQLLTVWPTRPGVGGPIEVHTEDAAIVSFETDGGAIGSLVLSQVAPGRKNRLWLSLDGTDACFVFDHERPDVLWIGGRSTNQLLHRAAEGLRPAAARYVTLPAGHPQGYQDCFNAFVSDCYAAIRGESPDGLPRFTDGLRAAVVTEAVLASAGSKSWIEIPAPPSVRSGHT